MRILYLTQWFEPEPNIVKGTVFVRALMAAGHEVTVVTGFPNYPTGKLYPGYRVRPIMRETIDGVSVVRLPLWPNHDTSSVRRSLNYLSFFLSAFVYCLFCRGRYDLAYVYHPPITVGLAAALAKCIRGLPFVLDVQDLWPDTIAATGMPGAHQLVGPLGVVCAFVYRCASSIVVQSEGFGRALATRGVPEEKLTTILNWADDGFGPGASRETACDGAARPFTVVYGGNLGRAQALETVVDAAAILGRERDDVRIVLYGDGVDEMVLRTRAARSTKTALRFESRVSKTEIVRIFACADALLLHLRDDPLFAITIPSKVQAYLAMGQPIVAAVAGEAARLLQDSGAAVVVPPGDAPALASAIGGLAAMPPERRHAMGGAGRQFYEQRMSFDAGMARTIELLDGIYQA